MLRNVGNLSFLSLHLANIPQYSPHKFESQTFVQINWHLTSFPYISEELLTVGKTDMGMLKNLTNVKIKIVSPLLMDTSLRWTPLKWTPL